MGIWYCEKDNLIKETWFYGKKYKIMDLTSKTWLPYKTKTSFVGRYWIYIGEL